MSRQKIPFGASIPIELNHPTDQVAVPKNALDNTTDGSTCTFTVFDPAKDEVLSALEAIGQAELFVTNSEVFVVGDLIELDQDDGTVHSSTVNAVDTTAGTITIDDITTVAAAAGNRLRVRLGGVGTMTEFGTPDLNAAPDSWGFRGTLASDHPGLKIDLEIDVEINFVGAAVGGLDYRETLCLVVKPLAECDCA